MKDSTSGEGVVSGEPEPVNATVAEQIRELLGEPEERKGPSWRSCERFELGGLVFIESMGSDWNFLRGCLVVDTKERIGPFLFRTGQDNSGEYRYPVGNFQLRDAVAITRFLESLAEQLEQDATKKSGDGAAVLDKADDSGEPAAGAEEKNEGRNE